MNNQQAAQVINTKIANVSSLREDFVQTLINLVEIIGSKHTEQQLLRAGRTIHNYCEKYSLTFSQARKSLNF